MLQVLVISVAGVAVVAIIGLFFYSAHQADKTLQQRVDAADAGGRALSLDEKTAAELRHIRPTPPGPVARGYFAYRKRNALTRRQVVWGAVAIGGLWVSMTLGAGYGPIVGVASYLGLGTALLLIGLWARRNGTPG